MLLRVFCSLILVLFFLLQSVVVAQSSPESLAVIDLDVEYGVEKNFAAALSTIIRNEINRYGKFSVVAEDDLRQVISRDQLLQAMGGCEGDECSGLVDFGRTIGTRFMVIGSLSKIGKTYTLNLRMLDTKGGNAGIIRRVSERCKCSDDDLIEVASFLAAKVIGERSRDEIEQEKQLAREKRQREEERKSHLEAQRKKLKEEERAKKINEELALRKELELQVRREKAEDFFKMMEEGSKALSDEKWNTAIYLFDSLYETLQQNPGLLVEAFPEKNQYFKSWTEALKFFTSFYIHFAKGMAAAETGNWQLTNSELAIARQIFDKKPNFIPGDFMSAKDISDLEEGLHLSIFGFQHVPQEELANRYIKNGEYSLAKAIVLEMIRSLDSHPMANKPDMIELRKQWMSGLESINQLMQN